jgi:H+/Cl- antiporter ClcA
VAREENAAQNNADPGSVLNAIRWGLLLAAIGTVGFRVPRLLSEFRQWRDALHMEDAVSAEHWHTVLKVDLLAALVVLAIGVAAYYLLRPRTKAAK